MKYKFDVGDRVRILGTEADESRMKYRGYLATVVELSRLPWIKFDNGESKVFHENELVLIEEVEKMKPKYDIGDVVGTEYAAFKIGEILISRRKGSFEYIYRPDNQEHWTSETNIVKLYK